MSKKPSNPEPKMHLGDWLKLLDVEVGRAAKMADCGQSYISNMIAGRRTNPNTLILYRLTEKLGITINDLYRQVPRAPEVETLQNLSPRAQQTVLALRHKKA